MNIILTSVGRRTYLVNYFKDALNEIGKVFVSNSSISIATKEADDFLITPLIYDKEYIPVLLNYCIDNNITHVISVFDIDLLVLSKNIELFKNNGITILLAPYESVKICNDKWETYLFLKEKNVNTPKTFLNIEDVIQKIATNQLSYPIIIKPRWGMASIGIYIAENKEELVVLSNKCKNDILSSHLKYESSFTPENSVVYQEKINGQEYGLDVINNLERKYVTTLAKKKISMRAGETDIGETCSSKIFEQIAIKLSNEIAHQVILSVDCFVKDEEIFVLEMNCRISGHYPISHLANVNLPKQIIKWVKGEGTDLSLLTIKEGLKVTKDLVPTIL